VCAFSGASGRQNLEQAQKIIVDLSEEAEIELPIEGVLRFQTQIWFQR